MEILRVHYYLLQKFAGGNVLYFPNPEQANPLQLEFNDKLQNF